jgi:hypothetical protein
MNEQDKQFLACLCVWLDWNIYRSIEAVVSHDFENTKSFEEMRLEAKELVDEFSKPPKDDTL